MVPVDNLGDTALLVHRNVLRVEARDGRNEAFVSARGRKTKNDNI